MSATDLLQEKEFSVLEISQERYHILFETGMIPENTELIEGVVFRKMPKDPIHSSLVRKLLRFISSKLPINFDIRSENPIVISELNSEPEPDLCIVDAREDDYATAHPTTAHWILEIANQSLKLDRKKISLYATARVPEYWIINLQDSLVEIYLDPKDGVYQEQLKKNFNESISPQKFREISIKLNSFIKK